jgi:serine/threonine protein kinase
MAFLHDRHRMVHRDLKSLNVLVTDRWSALVADFGLSRTRTDSTTVTAGMRREQPRPTVGTLQWMAPELMSLQGHRDYFAADVYAFGIILWELAAREPPYVGVDEGTIRAGVKAGERPEIPADCPAEWAALIKACWAQKPADRPRFAALAGPLRALVDATPGAAQTPPPGSSERYVLGGRL